jgi:hypothetical protein
MPRIQERTPKVITDDVLAFAGDMDAAPPVYVRVSPTPDAHVADRFGNVERFCRRTGATPVFGRAIMTAADLYLVGHFHFVASTPDGFVDVTPSPVGDERTLFAAYLALPDCVPQSRPTIRARVHGAAERRKEIEAVLEAATDADAASARKNGITVRQLLLSRLPRDQLAARIDEYLRAEGKLEAVVVAAYDGGRVREPVHIPDLHAEFQRLERRRHELYAIADRQFSS